ncbi:hypothetical protein BESB_056540 [Besnoitia besnoiti]|uniref:FH2 domain-containing protein n=1 Tax=Besnoitia besnoiti TaxID=94643 RepID=A0A2A9MK13_BESBE|nr:hypothetical protein BESB_056540 [Besnoitia besnoiti]PFH36003.1 hypothetical protein BESB_056540 [Besnoitia besnoiti]
MPGEGLRGPCRAARADAHHSAGVSASPFLGRRCVEPLPAGTFPSPASHSKAIRASPGHAETQSLLSSLSFFHMFFGPEEASETRRDGVHVRTPPSHAKPSDVEAPRSLLSFLDVPSLFALPPAHERRPSGGSPTIAAAPARHPDASEGRSWLSLPKVAPLFPDLPRRRGSTSSVQSESEDAASSGGPLSARRPGSERGGGAVASPASSFSSVSSAGSSPLPERLNLYTSSEELLEDSADEATRAETKTPQDKAFFTPSPARPGSSFHRRSDRFFLSPSQAAGASPEGSSNAHRAPRMSQPNWHVVRSPPEGGARQAFSSPRGSPFLAAAPVPPQTLRAAAEPARRSLERLDCPARTAASRNGIRTTFSPPLTRREAQTRTASNGAAVAGGTGEQKTSFRDHQGGSTASKKISRIVSRGPARATATGIRRSETGRGSRGGRMSATFLPRQSTLYALHAPQPPAVGGSPGAPKKSLSASETRALAHSQWLLPGGRITPTSTPWEGGTAPLEGDVHASAFRPPPHAVVTEKHPQLGRRRPSSTLPHREDVLGGSDKNAPCGSAHGVVGQQRVLPASVSGGLSEVMKNSEAKRERGDGDEAEERKRASLPASPVSRASDFSRTTKVSEVSVEETMAEVERLLKESEERRAKAIHGALQDHAGSRRLEPGQAPTANVRMHRSFTGLGNDSRSPLSFWAAGSRSVEIPRLPLGAQDASSVPSPPLWLICAKPFSAKKLPMGAPPPVGHQAVSPPPPACSPVSPSPLVQTCLVAERLMAMRTPWRLPTTSILRRNNVMDVVLYLATLQNLLRGSGPTREELLQRVGRRRRVNHVLAQLREAAHVDPAACPWRAPRERRALLDTQKDEKEAKQDAGDGNSNQSATTPEDANDEGRDLKEAAKRTQFMIDLVDEEDVAATRKESVRFQGRQPDPVSLPLANGSPYLMASNQQRLVRRFLQMPSSPSNGCSGLVEFNILYAFIRSHRGPSFAEFRALKQNTGAALPGGCQQCDGDCAPLGASMQFVLAQLDDTPQNARKRGGLTCAAGVCEASGLRGPRVPANRHGPSSACAGGDSEEGAGARLAQTLSAVEVEAAIQLVTRAAEIADAAAGDKIIPGASTPDGASADVSPASTRRRPDPATDITAALWRFLEEESHATHAGLVGAERATGHQQDDANRLAVSEVLSVLYPSPALFIIWDIVPTAAPGAAPANVSRGVAASSGPVAGSVFAPGTSALSAAGHQPRGSPHASATVPSASMPSVTAGAPRLRDDCGGAYHGDGLSPRSPQAPPSGLEEFYKLFREQVLRYQTAEVGAPTLQLLVHFCSSIAFWLQLDRFQHFGVINLDPGCGYQGLLMLACSALAHSKLTAAEVLQMLRASSIAAQDGGQSGRTLRGGAGAGFLTQRDRGDAAGGAGGLPRQTSTSLAGALSTTRKLGAGDKGRSVGAVKKKTWGVICWQDAEEWPPSCRRYLHYFDRLIKRGGIEYGFPLSPVPATTTESDEPSGSRDRVGNHRADGATALDPSPLETGGPSASSPVARDIDAPMKSGIPATPYRLKNIIMENFTPPAELVCVEVYEIALCYGCRCQSSRARLPPSSSPSASIASSKRPDSLGNGASAASPTAPALPPETPRGGGGHRQSRGTSASTLLSPRLRLPKNPFKKRGTSPSGRDGAGELEDACVQNASGTALATSGITTTMHSSLYAHPYIKALRQQELLSSHKAGRGAGLPDRIPLLLEPDGPLGHLAPCCVSSAVPPPGLSPLASQGEAEDQVKNQGTNKEHGGEKSAQDGPEAPHSATDTAADGLPKLAITPPSPGLGPAGVGVSAGAPWGRTPTADGSEETLCCPVCCWGRVGADGGGAPASRGGPFEGSGRHRGGPGSVVREQFILRACVNNYQLMAADTMEGGETSLVFDFAHNREGDDQYLVLSGDVLFAFRQLAATPKQSTESAEEGEGARPADEAQKSLPPARGQSAASRTAGTAPKPEMKSATKLEWGTGQQVFATFSCHTGFMVEGSSDVQQLTKEDLDIYDSAHRELIPSGLRVSLIFEPVRPSLFETGPAIRRPSLALSPPSSPSMCSAGELSPALSSRSGDSAPGDFALPAAVAATPTASGSPESPGEPPNAEPLQPVADPSRGSSASPARRPPEELQAVPDEGGGESGSQHARGRKLDREAEARGRHGGGGTGLGAIASWLGFPGSGAPRAASREPGGKETDVAKVDEAASARGESEDLRPRPKPRENREAITAYGSPRSPRMSRDQRRLLKMMHDQQVKRSKARAEGDAVRRSDADWELWKAYVLWRAQQCVGRPKPDRREFWRRHVAHVDQLQLWRLSRLTSCAPDNCLVALKVCSNDVADALTFLCLHFAPTDASPLLHLSLPCLAGPGPRLPSDGVLSATALSVLASSTQSQACSLLSSLCASRAPLRLRDADADVAEAGSAALAGLEAAPTPESLLGPSLPAGGLQDVLSEVPSALVTSPSASRLSTAYGAERNSAPLAEGIPPASTAFPASPTPSPLLSLSSLDVDSCAAQPERRRPVAGDADQTGPAELNLSVGSQGIRLPGHAEGETEMRASLVTRSVSSASILSSSGDFPAGAADAAGDHIQRENGGGLAEFGIPFATDPALGVADSAGMEPDGALGSFGGRRRQRRMAPVPQRPGQLKPPQTPSAASATPPRPSRAPIAPAVPATRGLAFAGTAPLPIRRLHTVGLTADLPHLLQPLGQHSSALDSIPRFGEGPPSATEGGAGAEAFARAVGQQSGSAASHCVSSLTGSGGLGWTFAGGRARTFAAGRWHTEDEIQTAAARDSDRTTDHSLAGKADLSAGGSRVPSGEQDGGEAAARETQATIRVDASEEGKETYTVKLPSGRVVRFAIDPRRAANNDAIFVQASDVSPAAVGAEGGSTDRAPGATAGTGPVREFAANEEDGDSTVSGVRPGSQQVGRQGPARELASAGCAAVTTEGGEGGSGDLNHEASPLPTNQLGVARSQAISSASTALGANAEISSTSGQQALESAQRAGGGTQAPGAGQGPQLPPEEMRVAVAGGATETQGIVDGGVLGIGYRADGAPIPAAQAGAALRPPQAREVPVPGAGGHAEGGIQSDRMTAGATATVERPGAGVADLGVPAAGLFAGLTPDAVSQLAADVPGSDSVARSGTEAGKGVPGAGLGQFALHASIRSSSRVSPPRTGLVGARPPRDADGASANHGASSAAAPNTGSEKGALPSGASEFHGIVGASAHMAPNDELGKLAHGQDVRPPAGVTAAAPETVPLGPTGVMCAGTAAGPAVGSATAPPGAQSAPGGGAGVIPGGGAAVPPGHEPLAALGAGVSPPSGSGVPAGFALAPPDGVFPSGVAASGVSQPSVTHQALAGGYLMSHEATPSVSLSAVPAPDALSASSAGPLPVVCESGSPVVLSGVLLAVPSRGSATSLVGGSPVVPSGGSPVVGGAGSPVVGGIGPAVTTPLAPHAASVGGAPMAPAGDTAGPQPDSVRLTSGGSVSEAGSASRAASGAGGLGRQAVRRGKGLDPPLTPMYPPNTEEEGRCPTSPGEGPRCRGKATGGGAPGKGKAPPLPPKKKPPPLGKAPKLGGPPKEKAEAVDPKTLPLKRRIHWKTLGKEQIEGTVFKELEGDPAIPDMFDPEAISRLFSTALSAKSVEALAKVGPKRPEEKKFTILDNKRAQNVAIVLARLPLSLEELAKKLMCLDTEGLNIDILQKAEQVAPAPEELAKFLEYEAQRQAEPEKTPELRDVEKRMTALVPLTRLSSRVRIMQTALQWEKVVEEVETQLDLLCKAADEAHNSRKFRSLLQAVLQWGNYVNHGVKKAPQGHGHSAESPETASLSPTSQADGAKGGDDRQALQELPPVMLVKELPTKGFKLASLTKLMEFKTTIDKSICSLHFIISNLIVSLPELDIVDLASDMPSLDAAARVSDESVDASITYLRNEAAFLLSQIHALKHPTSSSDTLPKSASEGAAGKSGEHTPEEAAAQAELTRMQKLHGEMVLALERLREKYVNCKEVLSEVSKFYGEEGPKKPAKPKPKAPSVSIETGAPGEVTPLGEWESGLLDHSPFELLAAILKTCRQGLRDVQANPRKYAILLVGRFSSEEEKWKLLKSHIENSVSNRKRPSGRTGSDVEQEGGKAGAGGHDSRASSPCATPRRGAMSKKELDAGRAATPPRSRDRGPDAEFGDGSAPDPASTRQLPGGGEKSQSGAGEDRHDPGTLGPGNAPARGRASDGRGNGAVRSRSFLFGGKNNGLIPRRQSSLLDGQNFRDDTQVRRGDSPRLGALSGDDTSRQTSGAKTAPAREDQKVAEGRRASGPTTRPLRISKSSIALVSRNSGLATRKSLPPLAPARSPLASSAEKATSSDASDRKAEALRRHATAQALLNRQASQFAAGIPSSTLSSGLQSPTSASSLESLSAATRGGDSSGPPTPPGALAGGKDPALKSGLPGRSFPHTPPASGVRRAATAEPQPISPSESRPTEAASGNEGDGRGTEGRAKIKASEKKTAPLSIAKDGRDGERQRGTRRTEEDKAAGKIERRQEGGDAPARAQGTFLMSDSKRCAHDSLPSTPTGSRRRGTVPAYHAPRGIRSERQRSTGPVEKTSRVFVTTPRVLNPSLSPLDALLPAFSDMALAASINKALFADDLDSPAEPSEGSDSPPRHVTLFSPRVPSPLPDERNRNADSGSSSSFTPSASRPHHFPSGRSTPESPRLVDATARDSGVTGGPGTQAGPPAVCRGPLAFVPGDDSAVPGEGRGKSAPFQRGGVLFTRPTSLISNAAHAEQEKAFGTDVSASEGRRPSSRPGADALPRLPGEMSEEKGDSSGVGPVVQDPVTSAGDAGGRRLKKGNSQTGGSSGDLDLLEIKVLPSTPVFTWEGGGVVSHAAGARAPAVRQRPIVCRPRRPPPPVVFAGLWGRGKATTDASAAAKRAPRSAVQRLPADKG